MIGCAHARPSRTPPGEPKPQGPGRPHHLHHPVGLLLLLAQRRLGGADEPVLCREGLADRSHFVADQPRAAARRGAARTLIQARLGGAEPQTPLT